ncbi:MAG: HAD-IA family hydrolase [Patescibacteria group bacterium]|jgi:FMN phosphatase YigB (HAD superfamily)
MKRPKVITFDIGHTLVFPLHDEFICLAEKHFGRTFSAVQVKEADCLLRYTNDDGIAKALRDLPLPSVTTFYSGGLICRLLPKCLDDMSILLYFLKACEPTQDSWFTHLIKDAVPCLETLRNKGFRLGVISNANGKVRRNLVATGVDKYFEFVADSGRVGFEKPDPRIFQHVYALAGIQPDELLHIGDSVSSDVHGALNAGSQAALYDPDYRVPFGILPPHVPHFRSLPDFAASFCPAD